MPGGRLPGCGTAPMVPANVQILFARPESMMVAWDVGGVGYFDSEPLVVPGRSTFPTGGIYRLKVTNIEGREGVERYPTLEIGPVTPRTEAYLAHNAIPIQFTDEDFDQVAVGQLRHQSHLSARSGIPGTGIGRRRDAGQHPAGSRHRPDRRSRPSRFDPGHHPHG